MAAFTSKLALLSAFFLSVTVWGQLVNPNLNVTATVEISGTNQSLGDAVSNGRISGCTLERKCLLLTRQKAAWINSGNKTQSINFGDYEGKGSTTAATFSSFGIPNGVVIDCILDVSASEDIDLDLWFTVDSSSSCVAQYTCTGSAFKYTYTYTGSSCGSSTPGPTASKFGQCGGIGWTGPTTCAAGSICTVANPFFSQCL
ncbi:hypothetical protein HGRIS_005445 [Hohenbuehelia grisea]|uniref:CBM1 domain-containing protein n=1 Tax=Hohenbuehelia grisea TaxID=104357 RepID=A0ABR3JYB1_9AGAR